MARAKSWVRTAWKSDPKILGPKNLRIIPPQHTKIGVAPLLCGCGWRTHRDRCIYHDLYGRTSQNCCQANNYFNALRLPNGKVYRYILYILYTLAQRSTVSKRFVIISSGYNDFIMLHGEIAENGVFARVCWFSVASLQLKLSFKFNPRLGSIELKK